MSKSLGNVITPDTYISELGADVVRAYLMFIAPWERGGDWNDSGISGISRWLNRVWKLVPGKYRYNEKTSPAVRQKSEQDLSRIAHQTVKKVTDDREKLRFNIMISTLMEFTNYLFDVKET